MRIPSQQRQRPATPWRAGPRPGGRGGPGLQRELLWAGALVLVIALGFFVAGGNGRVLELAFICGGMAVAYALPERFGQLAAGVVAASILFTEAAYDRLGGSRLLAAFSFAVAGAVAVLVAAKVRARAPEEAAGERPKAPPAPPALEVRRARRESRALSFAVVHSGDRAAAAGLRPLLAAILRSTDGILEEAGHEDYWLLLPATDSLGARVVAERLRLGAGPQHALSIGIASQPLDGDDETELRAAARSALARAVAAGGNRTVLASAPPGTPAGWALPASPGRAQAASGG